MIKPQHNPDVLNCLANLSSDEVFTSPKIVNQMLDMLPQELFSSPETTFLYKTTFWHCDNKTHFSSLSSKPLLQ